MDQIETLLTRGVDTIYPTKNALQEVLQSGKKLKLYQGFDPTGTQLHVGHMVGLRKLRQWQELGHHVIFLIGDFTAMIGDPTGKLSARKMLSKEEVQENAKEYVKQAGKIVRFEGDNPAEVLFNSEWLGKMNALEFLQMMKHLTYNQIVERDMFQERMQQDQDVYANEFLYPVLQAYDSVAMDVDLEIGGSDQMFNMMMGRKLMRNMKQKEKFVMTTPLLTDSEGKKIGKTEGNVIALTDTPEDFYAKMMALPDDVVAKAMEYLTDIPMDKVEETAKNVSVGHNPMAYKKLLAFDVTKQLTTEEAAHMAAESFEKRVQKKQLPDDMPTVTITNPLLPLPDILVKLQFASSKTDAKRLIDQGGVSSNGQKISDNTTPVEELLQKGDTLQVGKMRFVKVTW